MQGITNVVQQAIGFEWSKMIDYGCFGAKATIDNVTYCVYAPVGDKASRFHAIQSWRNKYGELLTCYAEAGTIGELIEWLKHEIGD